jgi:hypothetical protein
MLGAACQPCYSQLATVSKVSERSIASTNSSLVESEVAEVEMLLETYFMHYDNTYNRLKTLNEYIKDTEVWRVTVHYMSSSWAQV